MEEYFPNMGAPKSDVSSAIEIGLTAVTTQLLDRTKRYQDAKNVLEFLKAYTLSGNKKATHFVVINKKVIGKVSTLGVCLASINMLFIQYIFMDYIMQIITIY